MDIVFSSYEQLHRRESLSPMVLDRLLNGSISSCQLASLAFKLHAKGSLTEAESAFLSHVSTRVPRLSAYLAAAFTDLRHSGQDSQEFSVAGLDLLTLLDQTKRDGSIGEGLIRRLVRGVGDDSIPLELVTVWLNKVHYDGLSAADTRSLTWAMRDSGHVYDYRDSPDLDHRHIVRRYPTGALSEKVALILPSLIAAFQHEYPVASPFLVARSLGFTGGTWDKLSSIPSFLFPAQGDEAVQAMRRCGVAMSVTIGDVDPVDRKLYQLRSVTGTIESAPLIVSSIASKQLAIPADRLLLDVRYGEGAFLSSEKNAEETARELIDVLDEGGVPSIAEFTSTPQPTGTAVGNAVEVLESIAIMQRGGARDDWDGRALAHQEDIVVRLFARLMEEEFGTRPGVNWREAARLKFENGSVWRYFLQLLAAHGVTSEVIDALSSDASQLLLSNAESVSVVSDGPGTLEAIDQRRLGHLVNFRLGGGGNDYGVSFSPVGGVVLKKRLGDAVSRGESLCVVYYETGASSSELGDIQADFGACFKVA